MPPAFGEFLVQARAHVTSAVSAQDKLPDTAKIGVIRELDRLVTTLARYLGDLPLPGKFQPGPPEDSPTGGTRAALDARIALRRSAQVLHSAAAPVGEIRGDVSHPAPWRLARAADQLAAGRDLLNTHFFGAASAGVRRPCSSWRKSSAPGPPPTPCSVKSAGFAAQVAPWMMRLSLELPQDSAMPATAGFALHDSSRWLWTAGLKLESRCRQHPPSEEGQLALAAIPANSRQPTARSRVQILCRSYPQGRSPPQPGCSMQPPRPCAPPAGPPGHLPLLEPRRPGLRNHRRQ